jgi:hypothetical protein
MHILIILYALTGDMREKKATYQTVADCEYELHIDQANDAASGGKKSYECRAEQVEF